MATDVAKRVSGSRFTWEQWIAFVRLVAVVLAALQVGVFADDFPPGYERWAWFLTAAFAVVALVLFVLSRYEHRPRIVGFAALVADTVVVAAYGLIFSYEYGSAMRFALIFVVVEAALRYGLVGGVVLPIILLPYHYAGEEWRATEFGPPGFDPGRVTFPFGVLLLTGLIVGWLVSQLRSVARRAESRAADAERLRDELSRRVDVFEAANRCARALGSSLDLDAAFAAFNRELRGLVPFDRAVILLEEDGRMRVMAIAGLGSDTTGSDQAVSGSILEHVAETGRVAYRPDIMDKRFVEEEALVELGLRSRVVAPLQLGGRSIGALSVSRCELDSFLPEEVELIALLGRLVANAVQNIHTHDAERATVAELRRLSALRADFVSLVSHELRSPMTAVIGAARTLQQRWRDLRPEQREAFLTVIGDETTRLETLIGDVLDTSRIEAGTFGYAFSEVDVGAVLGDAVAASAMGQDEVRLNTRIPAELPSIRGDQGRLRQLFDNLISNAVKYSDAGGEIGVHAWSDNGVMHIRVRDAGPGIAPEYHELVFEKFGRAAGPDVRPGTGLGLFIAKSFAEAHGGSLQLDSRPGEGATFTVTLPLEREED
jgi:signal transduction histidine kinase